MSGRPKQPFNNPFLEVRTRIQDRLEEARRRERDAQRAQEQARAQQRRAQEEAEPGGEVDPAQDAQRFLRAMAEVRPLEREPRVPAARPGLSPKLSESEDAEVVAVLSDLVSGTGEFDITSSKEYVEGLAPGVDRRLLRRLQRGDFARQAHLDLHGLTRPEAREAVTRFLAESRLHRKRCVLLIHGRGLNSPDQVPVLKNWLVGWLSRGSLSKGVLGFATARPADGGAGAMYVLLRK